MRPMTTADWLRRAAEAWEQAEATADPKARAARLALAEGYQRLAQHAALLADSPDPYSTIALRSAWRWRPHLPPMKRIPAYRV
jgi:hypothetical protein